MNYICVINDKENMINHVPKIKHTNSGNFFLIAGPCSIEGEEQIEETVKHLVKNNVRIMRGGVYKPRSSPYSFRGMGLDGLKLFYKACQAGMTHRNAI